MRLHFRAQGEGAPLIILHGLLGSLDNWQSMARRLAALRRVYSLDLRNHGRSPHSAIMNYQAMAEDVDEFIAEHALQAPAVLGHSMGGKVAMQLAAQNPGSIDRLLIVDIAPKAYAPAHRSLLAAMRALDLSRYSSFAEINSALAPTVTDSAARQLVIKNLTRDGEFRWRVGLDEISRNYDRLGKGIDMAAPFAKPALFIRGERSRYIEDGDLPVIRQAFPRADFVTLARAGHWVHVEAADAFYLAAAEFLTG